MQKATKDWILVLDTDDQFLKAGITYEIPVTIRQSNILACQFSLALEGIDLLNVATKGFCLKEDYRIDKNAISFCVPNSKSGQFILKIRPAKNILLSDAISIDNRVLAPLSLDDDENIRSVKLAFEGQVRNDFRLFQNVMSNSQSEFRFFTPLATDIKFSIFDTNGNQIHSILKFVEAGMNRIDVDFTSFDSGVYFYQLETKNYADIKRIVILKKEHIATPHSSLEQVGYKKLHSLSDLVPLNDMSGLETDANLVQKVQHHQE